MKQDVFLTNEAPGYLEYAGTPFARRYTVDRYGDDIERCRRLEVRETRHGFQVHNVRFERACDSVEWREASREFTMPLYQSSLEAVQYVKDYERDYFGAVAEDLEDQLEAQRIETGHELARMAHKGRLTRDIVDMDFNDGLTPEEALQLEKLRPIGFIGKDILAVQKEAKPVTDDSKAYREQLAREFRQAIESLPPIPEKTCGWCGVDVGTVDDHKIVDREPMCNACVSQYFPEGIER